MSEKIFPCKNPPQTALPPPNFFYVLKFIPNMLSNAFCQFLQHIFRSRISPKLEVTQFFRPKIFGLAFYVAQNSLSFECLNLRKNRCCFYSWSRNVRKTGSFSTRSNKILPPKVVGSCARIFAWKRFSVFESSIFYYGISHSVWFRGSIIACARANPVFNVHFFVWVCVRVRLFSFWIRVHLIGIGNLPFCRNLLLFEFVSDRIRVDTDHF